MNTRLGQHDADLLCVEEHHSPHLQPHLLFPRALLQREDHLAEISGNGLPLRDEIQGRHSNPGRTPVGSVGVDDVSMMVIYGDVSMMIFMVMFR